MGGERVNARCGGLVSVAMGGERNTWEVVEDSICNLVERRVNAKSVRV
jgi:hypothetical protein